MSTVVQQRDTAGLKASIVSRFASYEAVGRRCTSHAHVKPQDAVMCSWDDITFTMIHDTYAIVTAT